MDKNVLQVDFSEQKLAENLQNYPNKDWIIAGIEIMRDKGAEHITVEAICTIVGRSEDEFYQCYNGLESFVFSVLDYWYEKKTLAYISLLDDMGDDVRENIMNMVELFHGIDKRDEIAIRNWALKCPHAHKALAKVDRTRLDVAIGLFVELGFSEKESKIRAKLMYTSDIGLEYTAVSATLEEKKAMIELLLSK